jgi:vacuolar protein sorting-associated protein IST1
MLNLFGIGYNESKLKPSLKMASQRAKLMVNKKTIALKSQKKEIASLLEQGKEEKARIRTEAVIREDFNIEVLEIIELLCDLVHERTKYISSSVTCPSDIAEAVNTLIWVADKLDISELTIIKSQLGWKYGSSFVRSAEDNECSVVNERVVNKMAVRPPSSALIVGYLREIAKEYNIAWIPCEVGLPAEEVAVMPSPAGFSVPMAPGTGLVSVYDEKEVRSRK